MKKNILLALLSLLVLTPVCFGADTKAKRIRVETAQFNNNLSSGANNVQKALDEIDNLSIIGEANTASSVGTLGTGLFKMKSGVDLEFYKIASANSLLTVALQGTDYLKLTINEVNINHDNLTGFLANEHIDWTLTSQGTIHSTNYVDNINDSVSGSELDGVFSTLGILTRTGAGSY